MPGDGRVATNCNDSVTKYGRAGNVIGSSCVIINPPPVRRVVFAKSLRCGYGKTEIDSLDDSGRTRPRPMRAGPALVNSGMADLPKRTEFA